MRIELPEDGSEGARLFVVRHGESTWDALGLMQGQSDVPQLTTLGIRQSWETARSLAGAHVGALCSSDLRRAIATARAFSELFELPVVTDARLRERALGVAEGAPSALFGARAFGGGAGIDGWRVVDADAAPEGGESVRVLYWRVGSFVQDLLGQAPEGDVVVVSHGGVVRAITALLDGIEPDSMPWVPVGPGGMLSRVLPLLQGWPGTSNGAAPTVVASVPVRS